MSEIEKQNNNKQEIYNNFNFLEKELKRINNKNIESIKDKNIILEDFNSNKKELIALKDELEKLSNEFTSK